MSAQVINDPLKKAYFDFKGTIDKTNKDINWHNIKTAIKVSLVFISVGALIALNAFLGFITAPAILVQIITIPVLFMGLMYTNHTAYDEKNALVSKINKEFAEKIKTFSNSVVNVLNTCIKNGHCSLNNFNGIDEKWFPGTIKQIELDSFEEFQKKYANRPWLSFLDKSWGL